MELVKGTWGLRKLVLILRIRSLYCNCELNDLQNFWF